VSAALEFTARAHVSSCAIPRITTSEVAHVERALKRSRGAPS